MPERKRIANIGRMPSITGLPFTLAIIVGIILLIGVLTTVLLLTMAGLGVYSLFALILPVVAYAICFIVSRRYGEFYAHNMGKKPVDAIKTGAWLHAIDEEFLMKKLGNKYGT
jgi:uncharacterized membrane protein